MPTFFFFLCFFMSLASRFDVTRCIFAFRGVFKSARSYGDFLELPQNFIEYFKVTQRSLLRFYVHSMFTEKRKSTCEIFVSA